MSEHVLAHEEPGERLRARLGAVGVQTVADDVEVDEAALLLVACALVARRVRVEEQRDRLGLALLALDLGDQVADEALVGVALALHSLALRPLLLLELVLLAYLVHATPCHLLHLVVATVVVVVAVCVAAIGHSRR